MDWIIEFDICAILITSLILWVLHRRKDLMTMQNITFRVLLVMTLIAAISDLLRIYALEHVTEIPLPLSYIVQLMYSLPFTSIPMLFYIYVVSLTIQNRIITKKRIIVMATPYTISFLLILTSPFTHWHIYFNRDERSDFQAVAYKNREGLWDVKVDGNLPIEIAKEKLIQVCPTYPVICTVRRRVEAEEAFDSLVLRVEEIKKKL